MNVVTQKQTFFYLFVALTIGLINNCIAMDEMKEPKNKMPITTVTNESRLLLDSAGPRYWSIIAPNIHIEGRIDQTRKRYKCHHFALEKTLDLPDHLRFSTKEPRMPIAFVNTYFDPTYIPQRIDLVEYIAEDPSGHRYVSHLAIFQTKSKYLSKFGDFPQIVSHAPASAPAIYGERLRFKTLKPEYKYDKKRLLADIEKKKAKSFAQLDYLNSILAAYEDPRSPLHSKDFESNDEYLSFLHDHNTILDRLHEYPLSHDEMTKIALF